MSKKNHPKKFQNRSLVIATKHNKEVVIDPVFSKALGVKCISLDNFDTDEFGTFTGEVERLHDPLETARQKCYAAMELSNCDLAIASEGSFGPHPSLGLVNCDDEVLMFIDKKNNLEVSVRELSLNTNFNGQEINTIKQLLEFSKKAKFPKHALILRANKNDFKYITKGITNEHLLKTTFLQLHAKFNTAYVETDMRAMHNPTRMKLIADAAKKLVEKINSHCPNCTTPGFGITNAIAGLPCEQCGFPTNSTLSFVYKCNTCEFIEEKKFPHGKTKEEPMYCNICNP